MADTRPELIIYSRAIAAARDELRTLAVQYEALGKRKAQLEAFIANAEPLLPDGSSSTLPLGFPPPAEPQAASVKSGRSAAPPSSDVPTWKAIVLGINGKRDRFTVKDALYALERMGRKMTKNKFQIVRAELQRKTDVFDKLEPGVYAVKGSETQTVN